MNEARFTHNGTEFQFVAKRFILDGKTITAQDALQDPELLARFVEMKAGVIKTCIDVPQSGIPVQKSNTMPSISLDSGSKQQEVGVTQQQIGVARELTKAVIQEITGGAKSDLTTKAWADYHTTKLERKKLSSETFRMVERNATTEELKAHYKKIMELQESERTLYDRAKVIEQTGSLPEEKAVSLEGLKDQRRKLVDLRCKLSKKISNATAAKNGKPHKMAEWQLELDMANAEYEVVNTKILSFSPNAKA